MLVIFEKDEETSGTVRRGTIYVTEKPLFREHDVCCVQADGDELTKALKITGRPGFKAVQKFYGDDAKMIVGNW